MSYDPNKDPFVKRVLDNEAGRVRKSLIPTEGTSAGSVGCPAEVRDKARAFDWLSENCAITHVIINDKAYAWRRVSLEAVEAAMKAERGG